MGSVDIPPTPVAQLELNDVRREIQEEEIPAALPPAEVYIFNFSSTSIVFLLVANLCWFWSVIVLYKMQAPPVDAGIFYMRDGVADARKPFFG